MCWKKKKILLLYETKKENAECLEKIMNDHNVEIIKKDLEGISDGFFNSKCINKWILPFEIFLKKSLVDKKSFDILVCYYCPTENEENRLSQYVKSFKQCCV